MVLVIILGSQSLKYQLLNMNTANAALARGRYEGIGQEQSPYRTHVDAVDAMLKELPMPPEAIGVRVVHAGPGEGAARVTEDLIAALETSADVATSYGTAQVAVLRGLGQRMPGVPQVATFESSFHQTIPASRRIYAIPHRWTEEFGIQRYGYHGASHRYVMMRIGEIMGREARRIISCHLGESSSVCAIENGKSVANSFGMTPQSGLPHSTQAGDFDVFAVPRLQSRGYALEEVLKTLATGGGLLGISGISGDMRDIERAAASGEARAKLAIDAYVESIRHNIGAYLVVLGGCDALAFTGGIGENSITIREAVCRDLEWARIELDAQKNLVRGKEQKISKVESGAEIWVIPDNEELIIAAQTLGVLTAN